jgi:PmbA protein
MTEGAPALERLADAALAREGIDGAAGVEVLVTRERFGLTRFANTQVHQNVVVDDWWVNVRVVTGDGRVGVASAHTDDPAVVAETAARATAIARVTPADLEFPGLAPATPVGTVTFDEATATASPEVRAAAVRLLLGEIPHDLEAAGALRTGGTELLVATTAGQRAYAPGSQATLNLVVTGPTSSGYAEAGGRDLGAVDAAAAARTAVGKVHAGADPIDADPGVWQVVLEPPAVASLVEFLAYVGFGGRDFLENRSFAAGRLGERLLDPRVTIVDDPASDATLGLPFDFEGTPRRPVDLVRAGVVAGVVHDRWTGARLGVESTGHGLPAPNPHGPLPLHAMLLPGDDGTVEDLVADCERGLLVTRFHYTNIVHPLETRVTGMTRDGTYLVEDGRIVTGVRNLRFTQSILEALAEVEAIASVTAWGAEIFEGARQPAVRLPRFHFTSATSFA